MPGPIQFAKPVNLLLNFHNPAQIFVTDCDGDRAQDILVTVSGTKLAVGSEGIGLMVLRGRGDGSFLPGTFTVKSPNSGERQLGSATTGDFNGDGRLDVAITSEGSTTILAADGPCTFMDRSRSTGPVAGLAAADFDGDGIADLATSQGAPLQLKILHGRGDGTFSPGATYPISVVGGLLTTGDLDGDGRADLMVSGGGGPPAIFLQQPGGTLRDIGSAGAGSELEYPVLADLDGDGISDAASSGHYGMPPTGVSVYLGGKPFSFTSRAFFAVAGLPLLPAVADFDSDGVLDIAMTNGEDFSVMVLRATTPARFDLGRRWPFVRGTAWVTPGDFNGDGKPDLVFSQIHDWQVTVMLNSTVR